MAITHVEISEAADFRPVIAGLPNGKCQVPHRGFVIKGKVTLEYEDGAVESTKPARSTTSHQGIQDRRKPGPTQSNSVRTKS